MVGDRGVSLSGGQKARLGLARAVYQDKDIYLMDDPISALDAHVRGQIIKNVYFGKLKDRTRILVTHAVDFLPQADHIILMDEGRIVAQGTYEEMDKVKEFKEIMEINQLNAAIDEDNKSVKLESQGDTESAGDHTDDGEEVDVKALNEKIKSNTIEHEKMKSVKSKKSSEKTKGLATLMENENEDEDNDEAGQVESGDEGADEEEEHVDTAVYPSKLTKE